MNMFHLAITGGLMRRLFENRFAMVETTVAYLATDFLGHGTVNPKAHE